MLLAVLERALNDAVGCHIAAWTVLLDGVLVPHARPLVTVRICPLEVVSVLCIDEASLVSFKLVPELFEELQ